MISPVLTGKSPLVTVTIPPIITLPAVSPLVPVAYATVSATPNEVQSHSWFISVSWIWGIPSFCLMKSSPPSTCFSLTTEAGSPLKASINCFLSYTEDTLWYRNLIRFFPSCLRSPRFVSTRGYASSLLKTDPLPHCAPLVNTMSPWFILYLGFFPRSLESSDSTRIFSVSSLHVRMCLHPDSILVPVALPRETITFPLG